MAAAKGAVVRAVGAMAEVETGQQQHDDAAGVGRAESVSPDSVTCAANATRRLRRFEAQEIG
eukprot:5372067-Pleurochrysis_carterae.AAC.1